MKIMLGRLSDSLGLELVEQVHAWILCIRKPAGLVFNVTVPHSVLEWFVDAHDDSGAIWSEWVDYYPINGETREQLLTEMAFEIERFVAIMVNSEMRVLCDEAKTKKSIELKVGSSWQSASLIWMTASSEDDSVQT